VGHVEESDGYICQLDWNTLRLLMDLTIILIGVGPVIRLIKPVSRSVLFESLAYFTNEEHAHIPEGALIHASIIPAFGNGGFENLRTKIVDVIAIAGVWGHGI
jgi:hypothetical protein